MGSTTCKWTPGIERLAGRHTPTMNDGSFQRLVIELSCARALSIGMLLEDFDLAKSIQHFDAACGSRHKFEESPVIARVSDALKNVEEADCCIIVASNIMGNSGDVSQGRCGGGAPYCGPRGARFN